MVAMTVSMRGLLETGKRKVSRMPARKSIAVAADMAGDFTLMLNISDMSTQKAPAHEMLKAAMNRHMAPSNRKALDIASAAASASIAAQQMAEPHTSKRRLPMRSIRSNAAQTPTSCESKELHIK